MRRWSREGTEDLCDEIIGVVDETADHPAVAIAVRAEGQDGVVEASVEDAGSTAVKRMGHRNVRLNPITDTGRREERRSDAERMNRRTNVVFEAGERQGFGSLPASDGIGTLDDEDPPSRSRELHARRQPIGSGSHHHCIELTHAPIMATESGLLDQAPSRPMVVVACARAPVRSESRSGPPAPLSAGLRSRARTT